MDGATNWMRLDMMLRAVLLPPETPGAIGPPQAPRRPSRCRGPRFPLGSSELRDAKIAQECELAQSVAASVFGAEHDEKTGERTVVPKGHPCSAGFAIRSVRRTSGPKRIPRRASRQLRCSSYMDEAQIARDMTTLLTNWMNSGSLYYTTGQYALPQVPAGVLATPTIT